MKITEESKYSDDANKRLAYYEKFGFDKDALRDIDHSIRLGYYANNSVDKDAKYDDNSTIRKKYYDTFGYDNDAKYDDDPVIRFGYYSQKGFLDVNALDDMDENIVMNAEKQFKSASKVLGYENEVRTQFTQDEVKTLLSKGFYLNKNIIKQNNGDWL